MDVLRPFRSWTLWMSRWHTVTLHRLITVYNDMFDHMDGVMRVLAKRNTQLVLAMGPGNPPAVRVWTAKTGRFGSRTGQKPDPQTLGGANPDTYPSTCGFRQVWLDPSVPISCSAFRVSHLWSHSDMRLLIIKYWTWYVTVRFRPISRLDVQNKNTQAPNYILKMSVNRASTIYGLASSVIWVVCDHKHP